VETLESKFDVGHATLLLVVRVEQGRVSVVYSFEEDAERQKTCHNG
jgi:hypothetical protein